MDGPDEMPYHASSESSLFAKERTLRGYIIYKGLNSLRAISPLDRYVETLSSATQTLFSNTEPLNT